MLPGQGVKSPNIHSLKNIHYKSQAASTLVLPTGNETKKVKPPPIFHSQKQSQIETDLDRDKDKKPNRLESRPKTAVQTPASKHIAQNIQLLIHQ